MKKLSVSATSLLVLAGICLVGCEWDGSGSGDTWNGHVTWANFDGVYRAASGLLVTAYTDTTVNTNTPIPVAGETIRVANGTDQTYNGTLVHHPVVPGSLVISITDPTGELVFAQVFDQGDGTIAGLYTGTINYGTGSWTLDTTPDIIARNNLFKAAYQYTKSSGAGEPGSSKFAINLFVVMQQGNTVQFQDNNGAVYSGRISAMQRGNGTTDSTTLITGEEVTAMFRATGVSKAGAKVTMTGAFTGTVGGSGGSFILQNRRVRGTWIEDNGTTGEINGQASPAPISGP